MRVHNVPDKRSQTAPDEPYSAFCKVCWLPVYVLWIDKEHHHGVCPNGATRADQCTKALSAAEMTANLIKAGVR